MADPRATFAPGVYELLRRLDADVETAIPADVAVLARRRTAMTLGVLEWEPMPEPDAAVDFAEQFVVDVTGVDVPSLMPRLGDALVPFVKAMWVIDLGLRTDLVLGRIFDVEIPSR